MPFTHSGPLSSFFAAYEPQFSYNANNTPTAEFYRLCDTFHWERNDANREAAYQEFSKAMALQFNASYGTEVNSLDAWQLLCLHMGIEPVPSTLKECRQVVQASYVNLVDLVDARMRGGQAMRFPSEEALSEYTKESGKFFPREEIHAGDLLKFLRRNILNPGQNRRSGRGRRGRF